MSILRVLEWSLKVSVGAAVVAGVCVVILRLQGWSIDIDAWKSLDPVEILIPVPAPKVDLSKTVV